jgi:hypothetical protein
MTTVTIEGAEQALQAGQWLNAQHMSFDLELEIWLSDSPRYHFKFHNAETATYFALQWI